MFVMSQSLQTATTKSARMIETGQTSGMSASAFSASICNNLPIGFDCTQLYVDVETAHNFSSLNTSPIVITKDNKGQVTNTFNYSTGGPGDVVIVRAMYEWPIFAGGLSHMLGGVSGFGLANQADGGQMMMGTVVMRNEPYQ